MKVSDLGFKEIALAAEGEKGEEESKSTKRESS